MANILKLLPKILQFLPLIKAVILFAEESNKPGADKLAAVLDAIIGTLTDTGLVDATDVDALRKLLTAVVNSVVKLWNALGWPTLGDSKAA